jgi:lipoate---protein ligase
MIFVDNHNLTDPALNLALEEHVMRTARTEEDILLFYINEPSIIIGRNQNTLEEINQPYVEEHGIHVVRRLSGGGAVYHDLGNLNFSFTTNRVQENVHNFKKFTEPVIRVLRKMGVQAELSGRNDILVDGRKISGNAQYIAAGRLVSHGTLLLNSDLTCVAEALRPKQSKIVSKGIKSVRSRVANISEYLPEPIDVISFRTQLLYGIFENTGAIPEYQLSGEDILAIEKLANERYHSWDWNYGQSPEFNVQKTERFPIGEIDARIDVQHGLIRAIRFYGDFFGQQDVADLEARLTGVRYTPEDLATALACTDIALYFSGLPCEDFLKFLYQ